MDETLNYIFKKMGRTENAVMKMARQLNKTSKLTVFTSVLGLALLATQHETIKNLRHRVTKLETLMENGQNDWFNKTYVYQTEGTESKKC